MFVLNRNQRNTAVTSAAKPSKLRSFGARAKDALTVTANVIPGGTGGGGSVGNIVTGINLDTLLQDIIPIGADDVKFIPQVQRAYQDIYQYDNVAGAAVDSYAQVPFSNYVIEGLPDKKLRPFISSCERLNIEELMPSLVVDHMVQGAFIGPMLYNPTDRIFADIYVIRPEECEFTFLPFFKQDPIIEFRVSERFRGFLASKHPRAVASLQRMGEKLGSKFKKGSFELDPMSTLWVPRQTSSSRLGTSVYKRILPIYLIEKSLWRGTIIESARRQRSLIHLTVGDSDWEPNDADMDSVSALFQDADADPLGAIVTTRNGVQANEMRQGGDFWQVFSVWGDTTPAKLRAMGISESLLSGDATIERMEQSVTSFMDSLRTQRTRLTNQVFYTRMFPAIALANGFWKKGAEKPVELRELRDKIDREKVLRALQDTSSLEIPQIRWLKSLEPRVNEQMTQILETLEGKNVPVPIRLWAAAGGLDLDTLIDKELPQDFRDRARIAEIQKKLGKNLPAKPAEDNLDMGDFGMEEASSKKIIGIQNRNYGELGQVVRFSKTGKPLPVLNQSRAQKQANEKILKAVANVSQKRNQKRVRSTK